MPKLKNKDLTITIDLPLKNYQSARFDWTGKIREVKFQNKLLSSAENHNIQKEDHQIGKGFYNEFGIDTALGFEETAIGGWFHKIGIGLLRKTDKEYRFNKDYEIQPAAFQVLTAADKLTIVCQSSSINGYAYRLKKTIKLLADGFIIYYHLENTGEKDIITDEYVHNFIAINNDLIGENYKLSFPFQLQPTLFGETVNPEEKVIVGQKEISFNATPKQPFFFSNLSGKEEVEASWELTHLQQKIGIREIGNFPTNKINLWGWEQVISPELFIKISVKSKHSVEWTRRYHIYPTN